MLGDTLLATGIISTAQLDQALAEQRVTGALLGETLLALKFVTEDVLARALAHEAGVTFVDIAGKRPDPSAAALVPERFARKHLLAPVELRGSVLHVVQANPFDVLALDDLRQLTARPLAATCATADDVRVLLDRAYRGHEDHAHVDRHDEAQPTTGTQVRSAETPLLERLIAEAVTNDATDLHLEPEADRVRVRYRIDGGLVPGESLTAAEYASLSTHVKVLAGFDTAESRAPQDGRTSQVVDGRRIDLLMSTLPTTTGETIAIRLLEKGKTIRALPELGLSRKDLASVTELLEKPRRLLVVTGSGGSGTTSTLYAMLAHLTNVSRNILTLEDPVECQIPGVRQTQIRPKAGFTFATAMRSVLRQDPDVVMIAEMRDPETAQMALRAALSGVLVLGALPADDAASAVSRLADMGLEPYLLSSALVGVVAQRLIRLICPECKEHVTYTSDLLGQVGLSADPGLAFHRGKGCAHCRGTGYRGRTGVFEILTVDPDVAALIREGADARSMRQTAINAGMKTRVDDALAKAIFQQTTLEEVLRVTRA
jgi:type IV pilus assembly protein PilB